MVMDHDPLCWVCGGHFCLDQLLNSPEFDEDDQFPTNVVHGSQVLSPAQLAWIPYFHIIGIQQSSDADVFISAKEEWQYDEDWEANAPTWADTNGCNGESHCSTMKGPYFPLHSACLDMLQKYTQYQSDAGSSQPPMTITKFVDVYTARVDYCSKVYRTAWQNGWQAKLAPGYPWYVSVEWSHLYFSARLCWDGPLDYEPGVQYYCADPICEPQVEQFISTCLAHPQSNRQGESSPSLQLQLSETLSNASPLICCPREILALIASYIPFQSALDLHAISRRLSSRLPPTDTLFWRSRTLQLHSSWLWELHSPYRSSANANWKALFQVFTTTRREILAGAPPYCYDKSAINDGQDGNKDGDAKIAITTAPPLPSLPLGLRNRQRIWMCLECISVDNANWLLNRLPSMKELEEVMSQSLQTKEHL